jgi:hypothetical protein
VVAYKNPGKLEFDATVQRSNNVGSSAYVPFPGDLRELFGTSGRVPVRATFDGIPYQGSITKMRDDPLLLVLQETLATLGKTPGDSLHVTVELDSSERKVELDPDIETGLRAAAQYDAFRALAYSHQRQFVLWIVDAKRPETRASRIAKTCEMVSQGKTLN